MCVCFIYYWKIIISLCFFIHYSFLHIKIWMIFLAFWENTLNFLYYILILKKLYISKVTCQKKKKSFLNNAICHINTIMFCKFNVKLHTRTIQEPFLYNETFCTKNYFWKVESMTFWMLFNTLFFNFEFQYLFEKFSDWAWLITKEDKWYTWMKSKFYSIF